MAQGCGYVFDSAQPQHACYQVPQRRQQSETAEVNGDGTTAMSSHQRHWAEFLAEELTQPQGRNDKPKPSSLFQWALCAEQERKEGLAGAGRWANRRGGDATSRRPLVAC